MLQTEIINNHTHHWSDTGMKIRQIETGILYDDTIDIIPCPYTYEETDIPVPAENLDAQQALDILLGGNGSGTN